MQVLKNIPISITDSGVHIHTLIYINTYKRTYRYFCEYVYLLVVTAHKGDFR